MKFSAAKQIGTFALIVGAIQARAADVTHITKPCDRVRFLPFCRPGKL